MKTLAISTSSNTCSVALLEDDNLINELNIENIRTHSENLMPLVDNLFEKSKIKLTDIDLIACDNGPGSFTGIRIGIATVKALAEVCKLPVVEVSSLEALSYNAFSENYCSMIDARNNQVYCGLFDKDHNLINEYIADDINNILPIIQKYNNICFIGNGAVLHKNLLFENAVCEDASIHAKNVGLCALNKYKKGIVENADTVLPMYLRKSQAERMKNE